MNPTAETQRTQSTTRPQPKTGPFDRLFTATDGNPTAEQLAQLAEKYRLPADEIVALFLPEQSK